MSISFDDRTIISVKPTHIMALTKRQLQILEDIIEYEDAEGFKEFVEEHSRKIDIKLEVNTLKVELVKQIK